MDYSQFNTGAPSIPYSQPNPVFSSMSWLFMLIFYVVVIIGLWKTFEKAGQPGWAAIVPIYNLYILLKMVGKPGWWLLLYFIPIVSLIVHIVVSLRLAKAFGKSDIFGIILLWLLAPIGFLILGFGSAKYSKSAAK